MTDDDDECDCPPEGAPAWMATFSDMATLMLCFFVLLLSFANMDVQNFRTALGSVKEAFGVQFRVRGSFETVSASPVGLAEVQSMAPSLYETTAVDEEAVAIVEEFIRQRGLEDALEVSGDPRGVIVRAKDQVLFDSGQALLKDAAVPILVAMTDLFHAFQGRLAIEGHTDNRPISTLQFPSNWELSAARAAAVLRFMTDDGLDPEVVYIAGYADMRPVAPNVSEEARAQNRRVEFVFEYSEEFEQNPVSAFDVEGLRLESVVDVGPGFPVFGVDGGASDAGEIEAGASDPDENEPSVENADAGRAPQESLHDWSLADVDGGATLAP